MRKTVKNYIEKSDQEFLKIVRELRLTYEKTRIIGFDSEGKTITQKELVQRARNDSESVKADDFITGEAVEKEIEI